MDGHTEHRRTRKGLIGAALAIIALALGLGALDTGVAAAATSGYSYTPPFEGPMCNASVTSSGALTGTGTVFQTDYKGLGIPTMTGPPGTWVSYQFILYQWTQSPSTGTWAWTYTGAALPTVYGQNPSWAGPAQLGLEPTNFLIYQHGSYLVLARYRWYASNGSVAMETMGSARQHYERYWSSSTSSFGRHAVTSCTF